MRTSLVATLFAGILIGSAGTYFGMKSPGTKVAPEQVESVGCGQETDEDSPWVAETTRIEEPIVLDAEGVRENGGFGDREPPALDMADPVMREVAISHWYLYMGNVVDSLEHNTGHKFKPTAKLHAGPVEILEEQLAFMKEFMAESDRLAVELEK